MNTLQRIELLGQSIWYDNISRSILSSGKLQRMVDEGMLGVTSNPTIFDKAISGSSDYDDQIRDLVRRRPSITVADMIQQLMVEDIQKAADVLLPVYERTGGRDGYVSIEVTPAKARDTDATIEEVDLLWQKVSRRNLMVKIPATREGLPAIERTIAKGININVTLIFSVERYREVAAAYLAGLEQRGRAGHPMNQVASVASVFVSRIDTLVDELIQKKLDTGSNGRMKALLGKAAVANTKLVYQAFKEIFASPRFRSLATKGAHVQRPLWGSTGTKNPAYHDLLYVDNLIGPQTVNTVPPSTYDAILDHGTPAVTIEAGLPEAHALMEDLARAGIDVARAMEKLERDGVAAFEKSFDGLYQNLDAKKSRFLS